MAREQAGHRFGPEHWVTLRATGEHVRVEAWSGIAAAYRVRSRSHGVVFATEEELDAIPAHPEAGKHWTRCAITGCGAPLTPELSVCPRCNAPVCTCGRCRCARPPSRSARAHSRKS